jgi:hypothetical protein
MAQIGDGCPSPGRRPGQEFMHRPPMPGIVETMASTMAVDNRLRLKIAGRFETQPRQLR